MTASLEEEKTQDPSKWNQGRAGDKTQDASEWSHGCTGEKMRDQSQRKRKSSARQNPKEDGYSRHPGEPKEEESGPNSNTTFLEERG
ncbi:hypothetical protein NDU88_004855 [Pleurodeles waltl]|uniref:Uncharacterized protein n=1 Tax=Pleurodeles waltl TaxID=8319 RepID=A0AAV7SK22_PLEWA|nr:hypothetical protein NDU88_004855 [Pleurodeles waltl]